MTVINDRIKAIFFDFDGTLVDSIYLLYEVYLAFLEKHGHAGSEREFKELNGPSIKEVIAILRDRYDLGFPSESLYAEYNIIVRDFYANRLKLKSEVLPGLFDLYTKG